MFPEWFHQPGIGMLGLGVACAVIIAVDVAKHPQHMTFMNAVLPVTAPFGSSAHAAMEREEEMPSQTETPFPAIVGKEVLHCGSGCMIGDVTAEWPAFAVPAAALLFGWKTVSTTRFSPYGASILSSHFCSGLYFNIWR